MTKKHPIGVILAGGQSRRMGQDKAQMRFCGVPMLTRARKVLEQTGVQDTVVLGPPADITAPDAYPGPARAIYDWLTAQAGTPDILVIPVDMPALGPATLSFLRRYPEGAYFKNEYLPFYAPAAHFPPHEAPPERMKDLVRALRLGALDTPEKLRIELSNVNTVPAMARLEAVIKHRRPT